VIPIAHSGANCGRRGIAQREQTGEQCNAGDIQGGKAFNAAVTAKGAILMKSGVDLLSFSGRLIRKDCGRRGRIYSEVRESARAPAAGPQRARAAFLV